MIQSQSSLSKISATQLFLLLDTLSEKEGKAKWEAKAEKIRKLLDSNGMEVFAQFFARAVASNRGAIFHGRDATDSYKLLREQVEKVAQDPDQAYRIAEAVDNSKENDFRDFDLATFIQHFFAENVSQCALAVAFSRSNRTDLRAKAEKFLVERGQAFLQALADGKQAANPKNIALLIEYFAVNQTTTVRKNGIYYALAHRFEVTDGTIPSVIMTVIPVLRLPDEDQGLVRLVQRNGPKSIASKAAADDALSSIPADQINYRSVASILISIICSPTSSNYNFGHLVAALRSKVSDQQIDWQRVIEAFDMQDLRITPEDFQRLYNALLPIAVEDATFDIQRLWGGQWTNSLTQVLFLRAFLLCSTKDLSPARIPGFRPGFSSDDFSGAPNNIKRRVEAELQTHYASADAMRAVFDIVLGRDNMAQAQESLDILEELFANHLGAFMLSLSRIAKTWAVNQEKFIEQCLVSLLEKHSPEQDYILNALYHQSQYFLFSICALIFQIDPNRTKLIYERAEEYGWVETFVSNWQNPLALDIACLRSMQQPDFDLDRYLTESIEASSQIDRGTAGSILWKFLRIKADDEHRVQRSQSVPQTGPLSLKTVQIFLTKVGEYVTDRDQLKSAQATCLQCYPRLINYGAGYDDVLEARSAEKGNKLPDSIDSQMSELFGNMYRSELTIRDMVTKMREYKNSRNPDLQDLFCCIVHGMFDEYICYNEYPEEALEKTALLFGSIIKYGLLEPIPQQYALALILESVRDFPPDTLMHRFGVEALLQVSDQFSEWPGFCSLLLQIPQLQHEELLQKAQEGLQNGRDAQGDSDSAVLNGLGPTFGLANGTTADLRMESRGFRALHAEPPSQASNFHEPDERAQEKILFVINNLSKDNMSSKLKDLRDVLTSEHHQWFAEYLVEQRAKLEPNNQGMYFDLVTMLGDKLLMAEVLRETFVSIVRMMNSEATVSSATERSHLKNLGGWLGSLTLCQDKPIKHKNIYFVDLLVEGYESQRLVVVIPFTCKVLVQGAKSMVFKPPNPWLMEIIGLLLELYHFAELKLNLKFEIEVLCKDLALDHKKIEPAMIIRDRQQNEDNMTNISTLHDGLDVFDDLSMNAINRGVRERLTAEEIMSTLPNLAEVLKYPPTSGTPSEQAMIRDIIYRAFDQAIQEIIAPVVERSITIASISTANLISKDYALEVDVERYRSAARQMVQSLAGSLALVTCKEPLRMSITNYIRRPTNDDLPEHLLAEGAILMCVNDNLDTACSFVEKAAAERAIPEIEHVIEQDIEERRRFMAEGGNQREFLGQNVNRWSTWIPEPYRQAVGGLNEAQRAVYEEFDRRVNGMNAQNAAGDVTSRGIPDILHDTLPNLSTPAEPPALPHQSPGLQDARSQSALPQPRVNGFSDSMSAFERIFVLIDDVQKAARSSSAARLKDVDKNGTIFQDFRQILIILTSSMRPSPEVLARNTAEKLCANLLTKPPGNFLEAELLALLLSKLCQVSEFISRDALKWISTHEETLLGSSSIVAALVNVGLMDLARIDAIITTFLRQHNEQALQLLSELMTLTLFNDEPIAIRADFANSTVAMSSWLKDEPELQLARDIERKLREHGMPEFVENAYTDKEKAQIDQMRYVFREWVGLFENLPSYDSTYAAFLKDLHTEGTINSPGDLAAFLRLCIDACVEGWEEEASSMRGSLQEAHSRTDALARLIIMLVRFQGGVNGSAKNNRTSYLDSIMSTLVLVTNYYQVVGGVAFPQRVVFRLLSSILYDYSSFGFDKLPEHEDMMVVLADTLTNLQPVLFPVFAYGWSALIVHRVFVHSMLNQANPTLWAKYRALFGLKLQWVSNLSENGSLADVHALDFYRGVVRDLLVLHHDYQEFLSENHTYFCSRVPYLYPQLRNIILTSRPPTYQDLPDPTTPGLKVERLEEMKKNPTLAADVEVPLREAGLSSDVDEALQQNNPIETCIKNVVAKLADDTVAFWDTGVHKAIGILASLVLHIGQHALGTASGKFDANSAHVVFLNKLLAALEYEDRYHLLNAVADQIRYPNTHTDFFCKLMLHFFSANSSAEEESDIRNAIIRVVLERLLVTRPHPWGMTVLVLELQNNNAHGFWTALEPTDKDIKQRLEQAVGISR